MKNYEYIIRDGKLSPKNYKKSDLKAGWSFVPYFTIRAFALSLYFVPYKCLILILDECLILSCFPHTQTDIKKYQFLGINLQKIANFKKIFRLALSLFIFTLVIIIIT